MSKYDYKKTAEDIIGRELKNMNSSIKLYPLTYPKYINKFLIENKEYRLQYFAALLSSGGFHSSNGEVVMLIDKYNKKIKVNEAFCKYVFACFHELWHVKQDEFDPYSYDRIVNDFSKMYLYCDRREYMIHHNRFSIEIGANLYASTQTLLYLKEKYPDLYDKYKDYFEKESMRYYYEYLTHNVFGDIRNVLSLVPTRKNSLNYNLLITQCKIVELLFNEDFSLKSLKEIMNHKDFEKYDKKAMYLIVASMYCLNYISIEELTKEEIAFLKEAVNYSLIINENILKNGEKEFEYFKNNSNVLNSTLWTFIKDNDILYSIAKIYNEGGLFYNNSFFESMYSENNNRLELDMIKDVKEEIEEKTRSK